MSDEALPKLDDEPSSSRRFGGRPEVLEQEASERIGQVLAGKYKLEEVIGSGGMAHVFRATNKIINRTVAIKILRSVHAQNSEIFERFLREARTANLVQHHNVVDVIDVAQDTDGSPFIVQEYLQGENLLEYASRNGGTVSLQELMDIMGPVLSAIAEAHARGVVHRDIKPENIFLVTDKRGRRTPKVLDFGISKVRGADMTEVGMMMGTPAYMAPELTRSSKDADPRTDVWALGVVLFEMLTGRVPFAGDNVAQVLIAIATVDATRLEELRPDLPRSLSDVVARCLRREADERYENATALAVDLAAAVDEASPGTAAKWSVLPEALTPEEGVPAAPAPPRAEPRPEPRPEAPHPEPASETTGGALPRDPTLALVPKAARVPEPVRSEPEPTPRRERRAAPPAKEEARQSALPKAKAKSKTGAGKARKHKKARLLDHVTASDVLVVLALLFFFATAIYIALDMAR